MDKETVLAAKKKPIEELVEEQAEIVLSDVAPVEEEIVEMGGEELDATVAPDPMFTIAGDGESYASIAARLCPEGVRPHDFAKTLVELNGNAPVRAGRRIRLSA